MLDYYFSVKKPFEKEQIGSAIYFPKRSQKIKNKIRRLRNKRGRRKCGLEVKIKKD